MKTCSGAIPHCGAKLVVCEKMQCLDQFTDQPNSEPITVCQFSAAVPLDNQRTLGYSVTVGAPIPQIKMSLDY